MMAGMIGVTNILKKTVGEDNSKVETYVFRHFCPY